jgi:protease I
MRLEGKRIAVLVAEGFEDLEYWVTVMRLQEEGAEVVSIGPDTEPVSGKITDLVRTVHDRNKTVGIICHGGLVAISAGIVDEARATGSLGIKDDLENAGATWVDKAAFREGNLVWGRVVPDIPDFCRELVAALAEE